MYKKLIALTLAIAGMLHGQTESLNKIELSGGFSFYPRAWSWNDLLSTYSIVPYKVKAFDLANAGELSVKYAVSPKWKAGASFAISATPFHTNEQFHFDNLYLYEGFQILNKEWALLVSRSFGKKLSENSFVHRFSTQLRGGFIHSKVMGDNQMTVSPNYAYPNYYSETFEINLEKPIRFLELGSQFNHALNDRFYLFAGLGLRISTFENSIPNKTTAEEFEVIAQDRILTENTVRFRLGITRTF